MMDLPREELIRQLESVGMSQQKPHSSPEQRNAIRTSSLSSTSTSSSAHRLGTLERRPSEGLGWVESADHLREILADDVNGLRLSSNGKSSFLGLSSIPAAINVLTKVLPSSADQDFDVLDNEQTSLFPEPPKPITSSLIIPCHEGHQLIDSYFTHIHVFAPMLDEQSFRATYLSNTRNDSPWLALLNMVFAMGSIALSNADSDRDIAFYQASRQHLRLESLGSGHMETLHALVLMGGMYLHYRNRPNLASALLGAAVRVAYSLGLQREFASSAEDSGINIEREIGRRTWWSIYVLDCLAGTSLGRPPVSEEAPVQVPRNMADDQVSRNRSQRRTPTKLFTVWRSTIHNTNDDITPNSLHQLLQARPTH